MITEEDKDWVIKKLKAYYKSEDVEWEYELMEHSIQIHKPSDVRSYVENKLKEKEFDEELGKMMIGFSKIAFGDVKACGEARRKFDDLLRRAEKDSPGFTKARELMISEMNGDLLALRTNGKMGSTRMLMRFKQEQEKRRKGSVINSVETPIS